MNLGPKKYQNLQKLHQKSYEYFWNSVQTQILRNHSPKSMIWCKNCKEIQCFRVRGSSELFSSIFSNFLAFAFFLTVYEIWQPFFEMKISKRTPRPRSDTKIRVLVLIFHAGKIAKVRRYFCTIIGYNGLTCLVSVTLSYLSRSGSKDISFWTARYSVSKILLK